MIGYIGEMLLKHINLFNSFEEGLSPASATYDAHIHFIKDKHINLLLWYIISYSYQSLNINIISS